MTAKNGQDLRKEVDKFLKQHPDLDQVELLASDFVGNFFGKRFPIDRLRDFAADGLTMPRAMYVMSVTSSTLPAYTKLGMEDGDPDFDVELVPGSLSVVRWGNRPRAQALLRSKTTDPLVDPRQVLERVIDIWKSRELNPVAAFEFEFTLFDNQPAPEGGMKPVIDPKTGRMDTPTMLGDERLDGFEDIIDEIVSNSASQGIATGAICAEYGGGQFEINFPHYEDVLTAADHAQLFRRTVKAVARKHGMRASFIAKPSLDVPGSGQHIHVSVLDQNGDNIFDGGDKPTGKLMHAIGGLQEAARECMLFWAPNVNSYRRFKPKNCAPTGATWAQEHRFVAFRIPIAKKGAWRVENRMPGADANCYLALATTLAGMLHGLENEIEPSEETAGLPEANDGTVPLDIRSALAAARGATILPGYLTPEFVSLFRNHREGELHGFEDHISARELDWYL